MKERTLDEIRERAKSFLPLDIKEWGDLIEKGNEEDLRLVIEHLHFTDFVPSIGEKGEKDREEVDGAYTYVESLKTRALNRLREEFKPRPTQDFNKFFNGLKETLSKIESKEIRKEIMRWAGYNIGWAKPGSLLGGFLHIKYVYVFSLEDLQGLPSYRKEDIKKRIDFPYTGFVKEYSEDQYINNVLCPGGVITPTIPISPEEIAKEMNKLIKEGYLSSNYFLEIKEFFENIEFLSIKTEAKDFLIKNGLL